MPIDITSNLPHHVQGRDLSQVFGATWHTANSPSSVPTHFRGRSIMAACERAIRESGFRAVNVVATLAGELLYAPFGYAVVERCDLAMASGLS